MNSTASIPLPATSPPPAYEAAMADLERRAWAGQLTLAQARQEIFALREQFAPRPGAVAQWAIFRRQ
ncbi:hypothetical protein [Azohydromonas aeria]|uniref:hypothetical protein n=1 Tax=Azohydromonas aeria TaxID=2590212 RepID=UPI0012F74386|nr:hypothetical protein [Azohydromonas aeria]